MIKELLLSLAIAAFSGVSSFVGSPKKAGNNLPSLKFTCHFNASTNSVYGEEVYDNTQQTFSLGNEDSTTLTFNGWGSFDLYFGGEELGTEESYLDLDFYGIAYEPNIEVEQNYWSVSKEYISSDSVWEVVLRATGRTAYEFWTNAEDSDLEATITFTEAIAQEYTLTKNFINCDIASSPVLPSTYTNETAPIKPSYYVLMVSNAGGYGFTSESVTQTGGIVIRNFNLFDQYNNSGYYASLSFTADLPFNDCSITIEAFLPEYTITTNLERCTVSPAIPSSYTGTSFIGDYTFTAANGYGFNKNYTHWEVTNLFVDRVEFSNLLWGSFYSSVTLRLRASGGNSSISVTAIEYDEENYKLGYNEGREDGFHAGYEQGHADGLIAGDSYGVWNWLKQAARTTGEFLSIPLLPGFSIGGLLTALAGLVIIWFFIKGFLFKS